MSNTKTRPTRRTHAIVIVNQVPEKVAKARERRAYMRGYWAARAREIRSLASFRRAVRALFKRP